MKCHQCTTPAIYKVGEEQVPLCLDCYLKLSQINQQQLVNDERLANYFGEQAYMAHGLPNLGPSFPPRPQPITISGVQMQHINVNNSVVGTINTGSIGSVDQSISALIQLGNTEQATAFKSLTEAVMESDDLSKNQKSEVIEYLSALSREAAKPEDARELSVAGVLLDKAIKVTKLANDMTVVGEKWWPVLSAFFATVAL